MRNALKALLQVLAEAGITCRFSQSGGCEEMSPDAPCEMCAARGLLRQTEGR